MDDNLVPDFILPKTGSCRYGGSDDFLNGRVVGLEKKEGRNVGQGDECNGVVCGELYSSNKSFIDCRVDSIVNGEVVSVVSEYCGISLNNNSKVAFCQNRR